MKLNRRELLIAILIIFVIFSVGFFFIFPKKNTPPIHGGKLPKEDSVILTKNGFSPNTINIDVNTAVRWINNSGEDASVNSDDYPTNRLYPELNLGRFKDGQTMVHIFTKPGTYTYHNHLKPEQTGKVIVK